jgi:hypothetical protein
MPTVASKTAAPKPVPVPNGDHLTSEEKAVVKKVRTYMETKVQPAINKYWSDDAFPFELLPSFKELGIGGLGYEGYLSFGCDCTARRSGAPACPPIQQPTRWAIAALDGDRGDPLSLHFAASILSLATSGRKTAADWLSLPVLALVVIVVVLRGLCMRCSALARSFSIMFTRAPAPGSRASLIGHRTPANQARYGTGDPIKACSQRFHDTPASGNGGACCQFGGLRLT